jgi:hypothetical protein
MGRGDKAYDTNKGEWDSTKRFKTGLVHDSFLPNPYQFIFHPTIRLFILATDSIMK